MSSSLPEGAAHAPLKIEARGSKPALRGFVPIRLWSTFPFFDAVVVGVTHDPHEVGGAQRRSRSTQPQAVFDGSIILFLFSV